VIYGNVATKVTAFHSAACLQCVSFQIHPVALHRNKSLRVSILLDKINCIAYSTCSDVTNWNLEVRRHDAIKQLSFPIRFSSLYYPTEQLVESTHLHMV
jgi:hypothetical protein